MRSTLVTVCEGFDMADFKRKDDYNDKTIKGIKDMWSVKNLGD